MNSPNKPGGQKWKRHLTVAGWTVQKRLDAAEHACAHLPEGPIRDNAIRELMETQYVFHGVGSGAERNRKSYTPR